MTVVRGWHTAEVGFLDRARAGKAALVWGIDLAPRPEIPGARILILFWDGATVWRHASSRPLEAWRTYRRWENRYRELTGLAPDR